MFVMITSEIAVAKIAKFLQLNPQFNSEYEVDLIYSVPSRITKFSETVTRPLSVIIADFKNQVPQECNTILIAIAVELRLQITTDRNWVHIS